LPRNIYAPCVCCHLFLLVPTRV